MLGLLAVWRAVSGCRAVFEYGHLAVDRLAAAEAMRKLGLPEQHIDRLVFDLDPYTCSHFRKKICEARIDYYAYSLSEDAGPDPRIEKSTGVSYILEYNDSANGGPHVLIEINCSEGGTYTAQFLHRRPGRAEILDPLKAGEHITLDAKALKVLGPALYTRLTGVKDPLSPFIA